MRLCRDGKMKTCKIFFKAITTYLLHAQSLIVMYISKRKHSNLPSIPLLIPVGKM